MLKYLSPRTTRPRTLPLVWPGRPCSWPPSEPPNSRAARLRENFRAASGLRAGGERWAHGGTMSNRGHRAWIWYLVMVWERFGAGGKQHNRSGAVLASTGGTGRGRLPVPSPASTSTNYTNSTARAPAAEAKGPKEKEASSKQANVRPLALGLHCRLPPVPPRLPSCPPLSEFSHQYE